MSEMPAFVNMCQLLDFLENRDQERTVFSYMSGMEVRGISGELFFDHVRRRSAELGRPDGNHLFRFLSFFDDHRGCDSIYQCDSNDANHKPEEPSDRIDQYKRIDQKHQTNQRKYDSGLPVMGSFVHGFTLFFGSIDVGIVEKETFFMKLQITDDKADDSNGARNHSNDDLFHEMSSLLKAPRKVPAGRLVSYR